MHSAFTHLAVGHDWPLAVLALGVCFLASFTAVGVFHHARSVGGRSGSAWLAAAAVATGCGIWATHFIAMLAYEPGVPVAYGTGLTMLSLLIAIVVAGAGLAVAARPRSAGLVGGAIVGIGIAGMHYTGMSALEVPGRIVWDPALVAVSVVLGVAFAVAAFAMAVRRDQWRSRLIAALLLTLAIVTHHFTGMMAAEIVPDPTIVVDDPLSLSPGLLALTIANAAVAILGLSLAAAFADRKVRRKDRQTATAVNNMTQGLLMFDANARLVLWNDRYVEMYGMSTAVVRVGCSHRQLIDHRKEIGVFSGDPESYCRGNLARVAAGDPWSFVLELPDGRSIQTIQQPLPEGGWVSTHEDITQRRNAERQIEYLAHHDPLTGLPNRASSSAFLANALETAAQQRNQLAILCIDLDRFKEVNDVFGHAAGDVLLKKVAERLKSVADGAFVARLGGDEFSVVITDARQPAAAEELAARLQAAMAAEIDIGGLVVLTGLSIGVAVYPSDGTDAAVLLANGDAALYRAKREGRGCVCFFDAGMDKHIRERRVLAHELRLAIESGQVSLFYQPQARTNGDITGFEALARWHHPVRGLIGPDIFIPIAEDNGLIIQLGERILRDACREAATWDPPLQIAVNLSPVQFRHGDLPALVHSVLLETGLAPQRLELEITEGVLIGDFSRAISILRRLKTLGVRIAMDDFGTGYSSLSYLQSFPFDKIKIDRSFITRLDDNPQAPAIIRAVIGLARGLSLPVSAEGVETSDQLAFLQGEGCDEIQGYFIGRPQDIDDYADVIGKPNLPGLKRISRAL